jgi:hypothetical protein
VNIVVDTPLTRQNKKSTGANALNLLILLESVNGFEPPMKLSESLRITERKHLKHKIHIEFSAFINQLGCIFIKGLKVQRKN